MNEKEFVIQLNKFYRLLESEKQALIQDDGAQLLMLVEKKQTMLTVFEQYTGEITDYIRGRLLAIKNLQEGNLLLTNQAISYQQMFMDTIQEELRKTSTGYSPKRNPYQQSESSIINQSM